MFGIRTPTKMPSDNKNDTGSPTPNNDVLPIQEDPNKTQTLDVRKSIGEWEAGKSTKNRNTPPPPTRNSNAASVQKQDHSPKPGPMTRLMEGRACVQKAKLNLSASRNLKAEIKSGVTQAIDRLYQLLKEAEAGKEQSKLRDEGMVGHTTENRERTIEEVEERITRRMEEHIKLMDENKESIERLNKNLEKQSEALERVTYAAVAAGRPEGRPPGRASLHSIVVTSRDEQETGEEILGRIREVVKAKEGGISIEAVRKARDRKIIVGCKTEKERENLKERLKKAGEHLSVEEIKNKDPLLILRSVLLINTDEDVLRAMRNQNRAIFHGLDAREDRLQIKYRKKARNPLTGHIIVSVCPTVWNRAIEAGRLHIDLQQVSVAEQSPLVQCSRCLGYGHSRRFCKEQADLCSHCGGPHMRADCADWLAGGDPSCRNCTRAKLDNSGHNAFSYECPVRRKWDVLARSAVAYC